MTRVNVRIAAARSGRVHRAFTMRANGNGEDRRTYCNLGAIHEGDTEDAVNCARCLAAMPRLETWPLGHHEQAPAGMGITTGGTPTT